MAAQHHLCLAHPAARLAAGLALIALAAAPALAAKSTWTVDLTAAAEVPGPGDTAASGTARVTVDDATDLLCYEIHTSGLAKATMAHVHKGAAGTAGGVVVPLETPLGGAAKSCATIDDTLAKAILADPKDYYVNVHADGFASGAIRGQLAG